MPTPMGVANFPDLLDLRFRDILSDFFKQVQDMVPVIYGHPGPERPMRQDERWSSISGLPRTPQFTGTVQYDSASQGYDVTASYVEFAQGIQINRTLVEWDQFDVIDGRPKALARSFYRRRQVDAARIFNTGAFSVDTFYYNHSEGVALCSNSHTTTTGASTASGFDNLVTTALNGANLASAQIQVAGFRDEQAELIDAVMDELWIPVDLYETAYEIVASLGKVDTAQNNRNVHHGAYDLIVVKDMTDTNNWFGTDSTMRKDLLYWLDQVWPGGQPEFGQAEEFDTFVGKWRGYGRWTNVYRDWRFILGAQVS